MAVVAFALARNELWDLSEALKMPRREDVGFETFSRCFSKSWRTRQSKVTVMLTMLAAGSVNPLQCSKDGRWLGKSVVERCGGSFAGDARSSPPPTESGHLLKIRVHYVRALR